MSKAAADIDAELAAIEESLGSSTSSIDSELEAIEASMNGGASAEPEWQGPPAPPAEPKYNNDDIVDWLLSKGNAISKGGTFQLGPMAADALEATGENLADAIEGKSRSWGNAYREVKQRNNAARDSLEPAPLTEFAVSLPGAMALPGYSGAIAAGAMNSLGESKADYLDDPTQALQDATWGGALGAAGQALGGKLGGGLQRKLQRGAGKALQVPQRAQEALAEKLGPTIVKMQPDAVPIIPRRPAMSTKVADLSDLIEAGRTAGSAKVDRGIAVVENAFTKAASSDALSRPIAELTEDELQAMAHAFGKGLELRGLKVSDEIVAAQLPHIMQAQQMVPETTTVRELFTRVNASDLANAMKRMITAHESFAPFIGASGAKMLPEATQSIASARGALAKQAEGAANRLMVEGGDKSLTGMFHYTDEALPQTASIADVPGIDPRRMAELAQKYTGRSARTVGEMIEVGEAAAQRRAHTLLGKRAIDGVASTATGATIGHQLGGPWGAMALGVGGGWAGRSHSIPDAAGVLGRGLERLGQQPPNASFLLGRHGGGHRVWTQELAKHPPQDTSRDAADRLLERMDPDVRRWQAMTKEW